MNAAAERVARGTHAISGNNRVADQRLFRDHVRIAPYEEDESAVATKSGNLIR